MATKRVARRVEASPAKIAVLLIMSRRGHGRASRVNRSHLKKKPVRDGLHPPRPSPPLANRGGFRERPQSQRRKSGPPAPPREGSKADAACRAFPVQPPEPVARCPGPLSSR